MGFKRKRSLTDEIVNKIDLPIRLSQEARRRSGTSDAVGLSHAAVGAPRMPPQLGRDRRIGSFGQHTPHTATRASCRSQDSSSHLVFALIFPDDIHRVRGSRRDGTLIGHTIQGKDGRR